MASSQAEKAVLFQYQCTSKRYLQWTDLRLIIQVVMLDCTTNIFLIDFVSVLLILLLLALK